MDVKFELSPGSPRSVYQNEVKCSAFDMENDFSFHARKLTPFYKKGCVLSLILKVRVFGARTWPYIELSHNTYIIIAKESVYRAKK